MAANLECFAGDCLPIRLTLYDDEAEQNPTDLTLYSASIRVFDIRGEIDEIVLSPALGGTDGTVESELTSAQTASLKEGKRTAVRLILTPDGGCPRTYPLGKITVR